FVVLELLAVAEREARVRAAVAAAHQLAIEEGPVGQKDVRQRAAILVEPVTRLELQPHALFEQGPPREVRRLAGEGLRRRGRGHAGRGATSGVSPPSGRTTPERRRRSTRTVSPSSAAVTVADSPSTWPASAVDAPPASATPTAAQTAKRRSARRSIDKPDRPRV